MGHNVKKMYIFDHMGEPLNNEMGSSWFPAMLSPISIYMWWNIEAMQ